MSSLTTYTIAELLELQPPVWLIEKTLPENGLIALYGSPGDGKSFIALDMALSVAAGVPWQSHATQKAYVVYVSAEGGGGLSKRVAAWLAHHQIAPQNYSDVLANFVVSAIQIHPDSDDLSDMLALTIDHPKFREEWDELLDPDEAPRLFIVVDTLARCFIGDENQQEDMGNFVRKLDELREVYTATILVVHHTGKMGVEERGSSSFRGACDTMMLATKDGTDITLSCTKQKDYEAFLDIPLELVILPTQDSCVVQSVALKEEFERSIRLKTLREYLLVHPDASEREISASLGISKSSIHRMIQEI